jgi:hypothetical protein
MSNCAVEHDLDIYLSSLEKKCGCEIDCDCEERWESDEVDRGEALYDEMMDELEREQK